MPYKDQAVAKAKHKEYSKSHYEANKEAVKARTAKNKQILRKQFYEYKATLSCTVCGENHIATLDFHHHTPQKGNIKISKLLSNDRYALAMKEIADKCIVLCSNCHRKHHYEEQKKKGA